VTFHQTLWLFGIGLIAGALNSVAGGGGFLCFPALLFVGIPPVNANATATLALWPATASAMAAYRGAMAGHRRVVLPLVVTGTIGGVLGAVLLLRTPQVTFMRMVPWLTLLATVLFALSRQVQKLIGSQSLQMYGPSRSRIAFAAVIQLIIATYLSFFGPGGGIIMLALFAVMGIVSIHTMNGLKMLLAGICTGVGVVTFIVAKTIFWMQAVPMLAGTMLGGYLGAWYAQKTPQQFIRWLVIVVGLVMTVYFFIKAW